MTLTHTEKAPQEEAMPAFLSNDALSSQSSLMDGTANKGAEICALHTNNLTVGYEGVPLISDIEIKLHKGEMLTLIGPNGAGKSTILKWAAPCSLAKTTCIRCRRRIFPRKCPLCLPDVCPPSS